MKKKVNNSLKLQLIKMEAQKERLIIETLRDVWRTSPMNFLSFNEWIKL